MYLVEFPKLGISFPLNRVAFEVFGVPIYFYGIIIGLAIALSVFLAIRTAPKKNLKVETIIDLSMWSIIAAIIGARLYYCAFNPASLEGNILNIFMLRNGGLAIYGGIIGAAVALFIVTRVKKISFIRILDFLVPFLALGQAIGRWGNFFNQEAFGSPTSLPWGMRSQNTINVIQEYISNNPDSKFNPMSGVHPTFLYESLLCLGIFVLIMLVAKRVYKRGIPLAIYMFCYGVGRFIIESRRMDSLMISGDIRVSQLVSAVIAVAGLVMFFYLRKNGRVEDNGIVADDVDKRPEDGELVYEDSSSEDGEITNEEVLEQPSQGSPEEIEEAEIIEDVEGETEIVEEGTQIEENAQSEESVRTSSHTENDA